MVVPQTVLEYLIGNRFSVRQVAVLLQVSTSTVTRSMSQYGITVCSTYTCMSDNELDTVVARLQQQHPNSGYLEATLQQWVIVSRKLGSQTLFEESIL